MGHLRSFRSLRRYCPDQVRWVSVTPLSPNGHPNGFAAMLAAAPEPRKGDSRAGDPTRQVGCAAGAARDRGADRGAGFMHKRSSPQLKRPPRVSGAPLAPEEFQANVGGFGARRGRRERLLASAAVLRGLLHVAGAPSRHGCAVCIVPYRRAPFSVRRPGDVSTGDVCRCPSAPPLFGDGAGKLGRPRRPLPPDTFLHVDVLGLAR